LTEYTRSQSGCKFTPARAIQYSIYPLGLFPDSLEVDAWMFLEPAIAPLTGVEIIEDNKFKRFRTHKIRASRSVSVQTGKDNVWIGT
jgi:hypothetical protein